MNGQVVLVLLFIALSFTFGTGFGMNLQKLTDLKEQAIQKSYEPRYPTTIMTAPNGWHMMFEPGEVVFVERIKCQREKVVLADLRSPQ